MEFQLDNLALADLEHRIRDNVLTHAYRQCADAQEYIGTHESRLPRQLLLSQVLDFNHGKINLSYYGLSKLIREQVDRAHSLLKNRVNKNLDEGDTITGHHLWVDTSSNLIEGKVHCQTDEEEEFYISVSMIWNYRYGSNSKNGVLTVYPQFRGCRSLARKQS
jgi:hypothetical protein